MIGLLATFCIVAYLLVPSGLFRSFYSLFVPHIKFQRTRAEEFTFAVRASILPFLIALVLVWTVANWPFGVRQASSVDRREAYRTVVGSAMSDKILGEQGQNHVYWAAINQVIRRQARFLVWYYILVLLEAWIFAWLTRNYGRWSGTGSGSLRGFRRRQYLWTATNVLLPTLSEWHVLLTPFSYPLEAPREVWVDVLTTVDVLYKGRVLDFFLDKEGELSGIFLQFPRRFDRLGFISDKEKGIAKPDTDSYWKTIPSNNLYIPKDKIANLNVRYLTAELIALGASASLSGEGLEVEAVQCRCTNTRHGHGNPCTSPATENDQMCKTCHDAAAREFAGTQHAGYPQDAPPGSQVG